MNDGHKFIEGWGGTVSDGNHGLVTRFDPADGWGGMASIHGSGIG